MHSLLIIFAFYVLILPKIAANNHQQQCGQTPINPNTNDKIVGGDNAVPYSWPWQVVLFPDGKICSGSIIADRWILTAAHCAYGLDPSQILVYSNAYMRHDPSAILHKVKQIHVYPMYNNYFVNFDIALLELEHPIEYNNHTQPICLPSNDSSVVVPPNTAWTTGWGRVQFDGHLSDTLQQVHVPFFDINTCSWNYGRWLNATLQVCAGKEGKDSCNGDSGGPLVVKSADGSWFQHGITSFGSGCAEKNYPGVYTRVSGYCNWIETTTSGSAACKGI